MSLVAVAKKEQRECRRSYTLLGTALLFVLSAAFLAAIQWVPRLGLRAGTPTSTLALLNSLAQPGAIFVPMLGLLIGYHTIAGEREQGTLRIALGLPNTRREVVFGKFAGRLAVIAAAITLTSIIIALIALATFEYFDTKAFVLNTVLTILYGGVYLAIAIGFSAWMHSRLRAMVGTSFLYLVFLLGWDAVLLFLQLIFIGPTLPEGSQLPDWMQFINILNPATAFQYARKAVLPAYAELTPAPESSAVYLQDWVGFPILFIWIAAPLIFGYIRFKRTDLF
ncbi:ABC transporter permease subunit [Saliphagus sp. LR7]|uniref:ABC transporter permease subunit n=1 Tax=Saliphagus sp. LR7 TaxID=2282654 RepID=UPI000DF75A19|nr:ABC transporter permease subunit [Saliphagus sp. LR7]